jgi:hypothetical protein
MATVVLLLAAAGVVVLAAREGRPVAVAGGSPVPDSRREARAGP